MYLDTNLILSAAQAPTATGDTASTNVYDNGSAVDVGAGEPAYLEVTTGTAPTSGGSATLAIVLQTSVDNSAWTDVISTPVTAYNAAPYSTANNPVFRTKLPNGLKRYIRVAYRIGTAVLTGGTFNARIVKDVQDNVAYASGIPTIS